MTIIRIDDETNKLIEKIQNYKDAGFRSKIHVVSVAIAKLELQLRKGVRRI